MKPFKSCPLELLPRWLLSLASSCLFAEACIQIVRRCRFHFVLEAANMILLALLILAGWVLVLCNREKAARACYFAYGLELMVDAFVMYFYHTRFYSPSHFFLQLGLACIVMAFCKQHYFIPPKGKTGHDSHHYPGRGGK